MPSLRNIVSGRRARFRGWWRSPASRADRTAGACVGAFGGFWVGLLAMVMMAAPPIALGTVGLVALCAAMLGAALGLRYPKGVTLLLFPFSIFGLVSGS